MTKRYSALYLLLLLAAGLPACKKWLEVQPRDKYTEPQVFTNLEGAATALNGMYLLMADSSLYGRNLSMFTVEILGQRYNITAGHRLINFQSYAYAEADIKKNIANIWEAAYVAIVNANQFVRNLDVYAGGNIPEEYRNIMRGEAIGLRAMLHFDMLRLFGPVYNTKDSAGKSIPYYRQVYTAIPALLPANQVIDSVLADLTLAEQYLARDPILTVGVDRVLMVDGKDFFRNRNLRMNYYAVKALQARVHLYRNNKPAALEAARAVVEEGGKWFPWITPALIVSDRENPDRVFSTELVMGLFNVNLYAYNRLTYIPELADARILAPNDTRLKALFENNEADYRFNPFWALPSVGGKSYKTFYKYTDIQDLNKYWRYQMPMIRLSELYYIMAECDPNAAQARVYINTVRKNRGLVEIAPSANLNTELQKEYQKEFFGEGQLFFYYKRRNVTSVPNSGLTTGNVSMNAAKYVLPLPDSELIYR